MAQTPPINNTATSVAAAHPRPIRINFVFTTDSYKRMFIGNTYPDPSKGHRKEAWATWILPHGTVSGGLLEKCLVWDGPGSGAKQLNLSKLNVIKLGLDVSTVPGRLVEKRFWVNMVRHLESVAAKRLQRFEACKGIRSFHGWLGFQRYRR